MPKVIIAPSVLASDLGNLNHECRRMMDDGADWLHMDIMDGHFVPNIVMGAPIVSSVKKAVPDIFMDCHMMVTEPERWVKDIAEAGGSSYTFHLEATDEPLDVVRLIKATGMRASVAINPGTPASEISDELAEAVDMILVMSVWPGAGGQRFMREVMPKVAELRARFPHLDIEVDGGVAPKTIKYCAEAGANVIVAGTAVFAAESPRDVIAFLRAQCTEAQERILAERETLIYDPNADVVEDDDEAERRAEASAGRRSGAATPVGSTPRSYLRHLDRRRSSAASGKSGKFAADLGMTLKA
ncbi:unnamed protein product [Parajaminaea phylloscopi]